MWDFEHSVEMTPSRDFVWRFWTDVTNWAFDTSVEWVRLEGPFASGTQGFTKSPHADPVQWVLREVESEKQAAIEMSLDGATLRFHWRFEDAPDGGTRVTQRATLTGANAEFFARQAAPEFERGIPLGMEKLAAEVRLARQSQPDSTR
ncbi:MAG TPA: SRPBCC family protein [Blastocatellia bacterium]|nr:SRPBCC family protein [Blastocatellia bacterium]